MERPLDATARRGASRSEPGTQRTEPAPPASHGCGWSCAGPGFHVWDEERRTALGWARELWPLPRDRGEGET
jgi:hypothetical protein